MIKSVITCQILKIILPNFTHDKYVTYKWILTFKSIKKMFRDKTVTSWKFKFLHFYLQFVWCVLGLIKHWKLKSFFSFWCNFENFVAVMQDFGKNVTKVKLIKKRTNSTLLHFLCNFISQWRYYTLKISLDQGLYIFW